MEVFVVHQAVASRDLAEGDCEVKKHTVTFESCQPLLRSFTRTVVVLWRTSRGEQAFVIWTLHVRVVVSHHV